MDTANIKINCMKKIIPLLVVILVIFSCTRYITTTKEVIKRDTIPTIIETIKLIDVPVECEFDTSIVLVNYGLLDLSLKKGSLNYSIEPIKEWWEKTTETKPLGAVRQEEKTKRNQTDEQYRAIRDSMNIVVKKLRDSLNAAVKINKEIQKTTRVDIRKDAKVDISKSKGGIFARVKNWSSGFILGLIVGSIGISILKAKFPIVSNFISRFIK